VQLPERVDVAIIGAGFAGAATAWALARSGISNVVLLERESEPGRLASGRSAGLGRQIAEDDDTTALAVRGAEILRQLPPSGPGVPAVWTSTGGFMTFDDVALADEYAARAQRFRVPVEVIARETVVARWPQLASLKFTRALVLPSDGHIDVRGLLRDLLRGVPLVTDVAVTQLAAGKVTTNRGEIAARVIVDASGAWAGSWTGDPPLSSFKRHVFVLEVPGTQPTAPWLWHLGAGEMYLRGEPGGVLMSPCDKSRCEPGHQEPDLVGEVHLRKLLDDVASELGDARIVRRWACQRSFTEDRKMRLGRDPDRPWLVWAAGLGGHGATAAPAVGERVAEAVITALGTARA
jgi:glycine/D-amino acid oxidase-like deaminating enzyme